MTPLSQMAPLGYPSQRVARHKGFRINRKLGENGAYLFQAIGKPGLTPAEYSLPAVIEHIENMQEAA